MFIFLNKDLIYSRGRGLAILNNFGPLSQWDNFLNVVTVERSRLVKVIHGERLKN